MTVTEQRGPSPDLVRAIAGLWAVSGSGMDRVEPDELVDPEAHLAYEAEMTAYQDKMEAHLNVIDGAAVG